MQHTHALVGDVGGTNARFALCELATGALSRSAHLKGGDFPSLEAAVLHYLTREQANVAQACIAIACPVQGDWVAMTNHSWAFSCRELQNKLGLKQLTVINDFTAVSMAIPMLGASDSVRLGGGEVQSDKPCVIFGAGTGLGVAHLLPVAGQWLSLPGEGGHVDFAATSAREDALLACLRKKFGHVSAERLLSGSGLVNVYEAWVESDGRTPQALTPSEVTRRALEQTCPDCQAVLALFCAQLGRFAGNLALSMATFGGVYLAGGIVPRFEAFFLRSGFRAAFEDKGRFRDYVAAIPVFLITHPAPGLLGAGAYLRQQLGFALSQAQA
ncbi:MAG: glucokinase [Aeromonas sp.]